MGSKKKAGRPSKPAEDDRSLAGWAEVIMSKPGSKPIKVYVVSGASMAEFEAEVDDSSFAEGGLTGMASPQLMGVASSPGLALEMGIHAMMVELRDDDTNPETGEKYLPGTNPLDQAVWVDKKGKPYDDSCPLEQDLYDKRFLPKGDPRMEQPVGRPYYEVYLEDPDDKEGDAWACVVVQELILDKQEVDDGKKA